VSSCCDGAGLVPQSATGGRIGNGNGLTRKVRRSERKARLRALVPYSSAVLGLDLGEKKQALRLADRHGGALDRLSREAHPSNGLFTRSD